MYTRSDTEHGMLNVSNMLHSNELSGLYLLKCLPEEQCPPAGPWCHQSVTQLARS